MERLYLLLKENKLKYWIFITVFLINVIPFRVNAVIINSASPVYYFVNHEKEILDLRTKLVQSKKVGITGITGKGKSELAKKYVEIYGKNYELIAFIDSSSDLIPQYIEIAQYLNKSQNISISLNPNFVKQNLMNHLNSQTNWLLIYDNVGIDQNKKIKEVYDWKNSGHIIITTQDTSYITNRVEVPYLQDQDSINLINKIIDMPSEEVINKIVKKCKGYPYLISKISKFIENYKHKTVDEVIDYIDHSDNPTYGFTKLLLESVSPSTKDMLFKISLLNGQKVSKRIINAIFSDRKSLIGKDIHNLVRLGVLEHTSNNTEEQFFRLHDLLQYEVLKTIDDEEKRTLLNSIIVSINSIFPEDSLGARHKIITDDSSMISNLEKLLDNSEKYNANFYSQMKLRKYVMDYYIGIRDNVNCDRMAQWLLRKKHDIDSSKMNDEQKDVYAYYLVKIGAYEELINNNYKKGLDYYNEAKAIADNTKLKIAKVISRFQLARLQIFTGNTHDAEKTINEILSIKYKNNDKLWYLQAKLLISQGLYREALPVSVSGIEEYKKSGDKNSANFFHLSLIEAEIKNLLKEYKGAYEKSYELYSLNKNNMSNPSITEGRILTQLAISCLGLNKEQEALDYINIAINNLLKNNETKLTSKDLADAYYAKGDILFALNKPNEALVEYEKAEENYYDLYRDNIKNMLNIAELYSHAAKASCVIKNKKYFTRFIGNLRKYFGDNNPLVEEVNKYCKING